MIPFSVLDLSPIMAGSSAAQSFRNSLDLAQHAEAWGYNRFWLAEHHNMTGVASAATSVVVGYVAAGTQKIRVGSGGIMLPNHSPLVIAEQFGTLESMYPGRVDLGLGRAPGADGATAYALRRDLTGPDTFPQDVVELQRYFQEAVPGQQVRAVPGAGLNVPIWILGSSLFGAQLAALLGLPYAFASHFSPNELMRAIQVYRSRFKPSEQLEKPYVMVAANVIAADTDREAQRLYTSLQQQFINIRFGMPGPMPPPLDTPDRAWSSSEQAIIDHTLRYSAVGSRDTVKDWLKRFIDQTQADELILTGSIFDHQARLRSFEIAMEARNELVEEEQLADVHN
ncbi:LLM class flavin-dependent oxidoreductase [Spirosoma pomorum]